MAQHYEIAFIQHLCIPESLSILVDEDYASDLIPTAELRPIYNFAIRYWHQESTRDTAPTPDVLRVHFGNVLAEHKIDLDIDPESTLTWAVETLRNSFVDRMWQKWVKDFATGMGSATLLEKEDMFSTAIDDLMATQTSLVRKTEQVDIRYAMDRQLQLYGERRQRRIDNTSVGARLGLSHVDAHTSLIHPGELCMVAAGPKLGKSFALAWGAYQTWLFGGSPVLITLENSVDMTLNRIACMVTQVDSRRWQRGECSDDELARIAEFIEEIKQSSRPFHVIQPEPGKRTIEQMVRRARTLGDSLYLDQTSFIEVDESMSRRAKTEQIGGILHELKALISSTHKRIPCILAHQINREGIKAAEKVGHLEMYHMADSAEVERTADWVFGLWQSRGDRAAGRALWQSLASRREDLVHWQIEWVPHMGSIRSLLPVPLPETA